MLYTDTSRQLSHMCCFLIAPSLLLKDPMIAIRGCYDLSYWVVDFVLVACLIWYTCPVPQVFYDLQALQAY
jgi:hypothetical protein